MEFDNIQSARPVIKILKLIGLWRLNDHRWQMPYAVYSFILHTICTFSYTIMMWMDVVKASSLENFSQVMYMSLTELALVAKIINVWLNTKLIVNFFHTLANDEIFRLHKNEERKLWTRAHSYYRWIVLLYFSMSALVVGTAFISVLFAEQYELPFPYTPPFEWRNERGYWYAYFYELLAMPLTCLSNCGLDMIHCSMLFHLALCYKMIAARLEAMGKQQKHQQEQERNLQLLGEFNEALFLEDFLDIVKLHYKTKKLTKACETFVSFPILIQIMFSSFVLCFSAYQLTKLSIVENPSQCFTFILAVIVMSLQIYLPCYFGNEIILNSGALNGAIFKSEWLQCKPKMRKYLIIYMEMLQLPVKIKAGHFFEIGFPVFVKTMNNTYSLMALLLNMNK